MSSASSSSSSPGSSFSQSSVSEFQQHFSTINEPEEMVITDSEHDPSTPQHPQPNATPNDNPQPITISIPTKSLPFRLAQRPSSIPPNRDVSVYNRPPPSAPRSPLFHTIPRGPSNRTDRQEPPEQPKSTVCTPKELYHYIHNIDYGVLILDVRPREEFERERIKASTVVCLEPLTLKSEKYAPARLRWLILLTPPEHHRWGHRRLASCCAP